MKNKKEYGMLLLYFIGSWSYCFSALRKFTYVYFLVILFHVYFSTSHIHYSDFHFICFLHKILYKEWNYLSSLILIMILTICRHIFCCMKFNMLEKKDHLLEDHKYLIELIRTYVNDGIKKSFIERKYQ